jgi:hypothetical protein
MIVTQFTWLLLISLVIFQTMMDLIDATASRCYLCSENTLSECAGSDEPNSILYTSVLQYYTEPCNGQCVLFRINNMNTIRGCSWTYGHMSLKSTGWHELIPGIQAYFCDDYLCNNGTWEQWEMISSRTAITKTINSITNQATINPYPLYASMEESQSTVDLSMLHMQTTIRNSNLKMISSSQV